jgi:hypothetical protein
LQSSGDTDGAANSIAQAEAEEGKARELQRRAKENNASNPRTSRPKGDERVPHMLSAAIDLRRVAGQLQSSGDTEGAANATTEAKFEERHATRPIEKSRAPRQVWQQAKRREL